MLLLLPLLLALAHASEVFWVSPAVEQNCVGVYAKSDTGGKEESVISVYTPKLDNGSVINFMGHEGWMALAIYKYDDLPSIGDMGREEWGYKYICNSMNVQYKLCTHDQIGQYIVKENYTAGPSQIFTTKVELLEDSTFNYTVNETGLYCVTAHPNHERNNFQSTVTVYPSHGALSSYDYNKKSYHGAMAILWVIILAAFGILCFTKELLPIHYRLLGLIVANVVVSILWFIYNAVYNAQGPTSFVKGFVVVSAVFSALRWALSLWVALYVAHGMHYFTTPLIMSAKKKAIAVTATFWVFQSIVASMFYLIGMVQGTYVRMAIGACLCFVLYSLLYIFYNIHSWMKHTQKSYIDENMSIQISQIKKLQIVGIVFLSIFGFMILFNVMILLRGSIVGSSLNRIEITSIAWPNEWKWRWFFVHDWVEFANLLVVSAALYVLRPSRYFNRMMDGSGQISQKDYDEYDFDVEMDDL